MKLTLERKFKKDTYTIGKLYINDVYFCDTLEDVDRGLDDSMSLEEIKDIKVYGETAIPTGTYEIILTYSPKFKRVLPLLLGVKGFTNIRIHNGNHAYQSLGCVLVGKNRFKGQVTQSVFVLNALLDQLRTAKNNNETIKIEIK